MRVRIGLVSSLIFFVSAPAYADGMPSPGPAPVVIQVSNWTGFYVGAQAAYGWGDGSLEFVNFANKGFPDLDGWLGGAQIGYQQQFGPLVAGVEASWLGGNIDGTAPDLVFPDAPITISIDNVVMLNGRLGWAAENWLLYVTGGYARAEVDAHRTFAAFDIGGDEHHDGWNLGGGIEYLVHPNVSLGVEYRRIELDDEIHPGVNNFNANVSQRDHRVDADMDLVAARLNIHLNRPEAAPLK